MDEKDLEPKQSADAKSTYKFIEEAEVVRKPPILDTGTFEKSSADSHDPTVQDRLFQKI